MKKETTKVVVIGGGEVFKTYEKYLTFLEKELKWDPFKVKTAGWKENLQADLGDKYVVLYPKMPNPLNVKVMEWNIFFKAHVQPHLTGDVILVGHSLGGLFLMKYLQTNKVSFKAKKTYLIAAPFYVFPDDEATDNKWLKKEFRKIQKKAGQVFLWCSVDDKIVEPRESGVYKHFLPKATMKVFENRGHFIFDEHFPELVKDIKKKT